MSPAEGHWAPLEALPLDEYEEIVVFDEWRTLLVITPPAD